MPPRKSKGTVADAKADDKIKQIKKAARAKDKVAAKKDLATAAKKPRAPPKNKAAEKPPKKSKKEETEDDDVDDVDDDDDERSMDEDVSEDSDKKPTKKRSSKKTKAGDVAKTLKGRVEKKKKKSKVAKKKKKDVVFKLTELLTSEWIEQVAKLEKFDFSDMPSGSASLVRQAALHVADRLLDTCKQIVDAKGSESVLPKHITAAANIHGLDADPVL